MKEMKIRKKLAIGITTMLGIACIGVGVMTAKPLSAKAETQGLTGFTSPGASVFIATDDTDTKQMRFQVNLDTTADKKYQDMAANQSLQSGVVVLPYDIYQAEGYTELTKDTEKAVTADVTKNWTANENGYESYAYLPADLIPQDQYNRILIARGYIIDGDNVYYTEPVRASMAYVAWQNLGMEGGAYDTILRSYMGPYTLTYGEGENEKIENLYYGDALSLPTNINGYDVEGWFWDEDCTNAITGTDYATGSMSVYYKFREFTVSGTVSCADGVDLTKVRILVDGVEKDAAVDASGAYSVSVESGTHDFAFACAGYKAYALNTTVSENSTLNAELKSDFYEIGNFGNVENTQNLVPADDFDGQYTVTGNNYLLMMPNTATTEGFTYTVQASDLTPGRGDKAFAASVSNGTWALSIGLYQWNTVVVNLNTKGGPALIGYYWMSGQYIDGASIKIVRTENAIDVYVLNRLCFTFTSDGTTLATGVADLGWSTLFKQNQEKLAGFFGEGVELACGIAALNGAFTATYHCNVAKHVAVSGRISAGDSVDLTKTALTVDGAKTAITVNADGTYTASVPVGTHALQFENGAWIATKEVTVAGGASPVDVTLVYGTWSAGSYGSLNSNNTPAFNENGEYTIGGSNQLILFPNTATSTPFTYQVDVSGVTRSEATTQIGICLTDGNYKLAVAYRPKSEAKTTAFSVCITDAAGIADHAVFTTTQALGEEFTVKFVVTKEKIEFYFGENRLFTFTKDSFASAFGNPAWTSNNLIAGNNSVTDAYKDRISGFFAEDAQIAVGINFGLDGGSATATYRCGIEKHVAVSGRISAGDSVDLTQTALTVDGVATAITVNADGTYTTYVPKGTHTFTFENGAWSVTQEVTVESGANTLDVTLIDGTVYEYTVSGTVSCADGVDLTTVRIAVDGVETDAAVDASGAYSLTVEAGTHDFTFSCAGYKAYALNTVVSEERTLNAELRSDFYEIGKFGNVENTQNLVPADDFDGQYTVTGNPYLLTMPNTATTEAFAYTVRVSNVTENRGDKAIAASVSNGTYALSIGLYQWDTVVVNLSSTAGAGYVSYYDLSGVQQYIDGVTVKIVRTESAIEVYVLDRLYFTFTAEGITLADGVTNRGWANTFEQHQAELAGFFGEGVSLACGIAAMNGDAFEATYQCNVEKLFAVSGRISAGDSVDLPQTGLTVDGVKTAITVNTDGTYTAYVLKGTHTFTFENGAWSATQEVTVVSGANTVDVTLIDGTWSVGNYGSVNSTQTPALQQNGQYTVSGKDQLFLFPNTATTGGFTYSVKVSNITSGRGDKAFAVSVSNGTYALSIGLYQWETIVVNLGAKAGAAYIGYYDLSGVQQYIDGVTVTIVRTENDVKVYVLGRLYFTFTAEGITLADGVTDRGWSTSLAENQGKLAGFFGKNVSLACGIANLNGGAFDATYTCNVAKHVAVSGTISAPEGVDVANTTLKVDGIDTPISVKAENGAYTASVPEGTHTLTFENGAWIAMKEVTVVSGASPADVTLVYGTWSAGSCGSLNSNNTPVFNENGEYTISGANQLVLFPNTATSAPFTFEATISDVSRANAAVLNGISLTDGKYKLTASYRPYVPGTDGKSAGFSICLSNGAGISDHTIFTLTDTTSYDATAAYTLKFVVNATSIEFHFNDKHVFTLTKDTFTSHLNPKAAWTSNGFFMNESCVVTKNYTDRISGFFAENAQIAVGINSGLDKGSATATYACSITKN